jgi:hypothetical protein
MAFNGDHSRNDSLGRKVRVLKLRARRAQYLSHDQFDLLAVRDQPSPILGWESGQQAVCYTGMFHTGIVVIRSEGSVR